MLSAVLKQCLVSEEVIDIEATYREYGSLSALANRVQSEVDKFTGIQTPVGTSRIEVLRCNWITKPGKLSNVSVPCGKLRVVYLKQGVNRFPGFGEEERLLLEALLKRAVKYPDHIVSVARVWNASEFKVRIEVVSASRAELTEDFLRALQVVLRAIARIPAMTWQIDIATSALAA